MCDGDGVAGVHVRMKGGEEGGGGVLESVLVVKPQPLKHAHKIAVLLQGKVLALVSTIVEA